MCGFVCLWLFRNRWCICPKRPDIFQWRLSEVDQVPRYRRHMATILTIGDQNHGTETTVIICVTTIHAFNVSIRCAQLSALTSMCFCRHFGKYALRATHRDFPSFSRWFSIVIFQISRLNVKTIIWKFVLVSTAHSPGYCTRQVWWSMVGSGIERIFIDGLSQVMHTIRIACTSMARVETITSSSFNWTGAVPWARMPSMKSHEKIQR